MVIIRVTKPPAFVHGRNPSTSNIAKKTKTTTKTDTVKYEEKNKDKIQDKDIRVVIIDVAKNTAAVVHRDILQLSNIITDRDNHENKYSQIQKKTHKVKDKDKIKEKDIRVVVIMEMAKPTAFVHRKIPTTVQHYH